MNLDYKTDDLADLNKDELRERVISKAAFLVSKTDQESIQELRIRFRVLSIIDPGFLTRMGVHFGLFLGTVSGSGTDEQLSYWIQKGALSLKGVIGCFGMTEMGHGSNVAALETTAIFDKATDEFIINTPTLTATKWWIGGAAQSSTYCCVYARLIVDGKDYGVKPFVVQLRTKETFELLPGISIGDMGMKYGRNAIDNGWIQFNNVRIPRNNMLMKHTKVTADGTVTQSPFQQLAYGALVHGRMAMVGESCDALKKGLTIAIRFSAVRRQFASGPGREENKILDYKTHQVRLFPLLAITYALAFTVKALKDKFDKNATILENSKPTDPNIKAIIETLKEIHGTTAGLKAYSTWLTLEALETCRQCMGGYGYSSYSALPGMIQDFSVQCTWEGDNTVLMLQAGRYLINSYREWKEGSTMPEGVDYINKLPGILCGKCSGNPLDCDSISFGFDVIRANLVKKAFDDWEYAKKAGKSIEEAFEACAISRSEAAKFHCYGLLFQNFLALARTQSGGIQSVLMDLCLLHGLHTIRDNSGTFLLYEFYTPRQIKQIDEDILGLFTKIRPQAVPLVDAFNLSDYVISTPLGSFNGDVYHGIFDKVKSRNPSITHPYKDKILQILNRPDGFKDGGPEISL